MRKKDLAFTSFLVRQLHLFIEWTLLGIAFIALLGFFIYYHRSLSVYGETRFKEAFTLLEQAKKFFLFQSIFMVVLMFIPLVLTIATMQFGNVSEIYLDVFAFQTYLLLYPFSYFGFEIVPSLFFIVSFTMPLLFASLIHWRLAKPLGREEIPQKSWFKFLTKTGLIFVVSVCLFISLTKLPLIEVSLSYMTTSLFLTLVGALVMNFGSFLGFITVAKAESSLQQLIKNVIY